VGVLRETRAEFADDRVPLRSAALAYYTAFSIAPLLVIAIATAGWLFGEDAARGRIQSTIAGLVGEESANAIEQMIQGARRPREGLVATVIGVVALLFGASGVFGQLKDSIDAIWEVAPAKGKTFLRAIHDRFLSFAMVFGIGFLLLVSLLLSAALAALGGSLRGSLPGGTAAWHGLDMVASFALVTLLFALLFKFVPDARISWRDARIGAATTAFLFEIG
jgi:membrane protein